MKKWMKVCGFLMMLGVSLTLILSTGQVLAQSSNFSPPTLIPAEDTNLGGTGSVCIGLATMIQTGNIHLSNLPCFVKFFTQTLIGIAGSLAVIFVMIGGYRYVIGGEENKDKAKKTITYALIGLAVSLSAWIIIDLVLQFATE